MIISVEYHFDIIVFVFIDPASQILFCKWHIYLLYITFLPFIEWFIYLKFLKKILLNLLGLFSIQSQLHLHLLCFFWLKSYSAYQFHQEQESKENDGRSNVYDCSEFQVISNCCYNNCWSTNCIHFICIYLSLPEYT